MSFDIKAKEIGLNLETPQAPGANYLPAIQTGNLVYTSGCGPYKDGDAIYLGHLGDNISVEEGYTAARLTMENLLKVLKNFLGTLDKVKRIVKVTGYVASTPEFIQQPKVINGASDLLVEVFGEQGRHTRCAIGVAALPRGMAVEIDLVVEVT